jgi:hypothetical protein
LFPRSLVTPSLETSTKLVLRFPNIVSDGSLCRARESRRSRRRRLRTVLGWVREQVSPS